MTALTALVEYDDGPRGEKPSVLVIALDVDESVDVDGIEGLDADALCEAVLICNDPVPDIIDGEGLELPRPPAMDRGTGVETLEGE